MNRHNYLFGCRISMSRFFMTVNSSTLKSYDDVVDCVRAELIRNTYRFFEVKGAELFDQVVRFDRHTLPIRYQFQCGKFIHERKIF